MKAFRIYILAAAIASLASCRKDHFPCISGSGSIVSQDRTTNDFTGIDLQTEGTVYVSQGTTASIHIEAQQNIIDDMETEVHGSSLQIYNHHCLNSHQPIKIYITLPSLTDLGVSGNGAIQIDSKFTSTSDINIDVSGSGVITAFDTLTASGTITADISGSGNVILIAVAHTVETDISGSGDMTLNGSDTQFNFDISGSGKIHAYGLVSNSCDAHISGSGNAEITVLDYLNAEISGSGDIHYKGNPIIDADISGSGHLIHEN